MSGWRQMAGGLAITLVVIVIVGASLSNAIAEQRLLIEPIPPTRTPAPASPQPTSTPAPTSKPGEPSPTATLPPPPTTCAPPEGWEPYVVQEGDTIPALAAAFGVMPEAISQANCLTVASLVPGSILYLPPLSSTASPSPSSTSNAPPTNTPIPCGPPSGWDLYTVQSGDTLYSLAQATNTTVYALQAANCLGGSTFIQAGEQIWLPFIPVKTATPTPTASVTPTQSQTSPAPTATPTVTPTSTVTPTATPSPTFTPTPSPSPSPTPSPTETDTATSPPPTATETGTSTSMPSSFQ
jgi:LysM repeat protein